MLKLGSNVSDVFPRVLKLSSEEGECKPLAITFQITPGHGWMGLVLVRGVLVRGRRPRSGAYYNRPLLSST